MLGAPAATNPMSIAGKRQAEYRGLAAAPPGHKTYHGSNESRQPSYKGLSALLNPEILLGFRLSAEWGWSGAIDECRAVTPHLQTQLVW